MSPKAELVPSRGTVVSFHKKSKIPYGFLKVHLEGLSSFFPYILWFSFVYRGQISVS